MTRIIFNQFLYFRIFFLFALCRYYRLWIYTCNAVLLMAVIVFCGVAGKVLLADYRRLLVSGLNLGQPSFIYAYLALLVQSGKLPFLCYTYTILHTKMLKVSFFNKNIFL